MPTTLRAERDLSTAPDPAYVFSTIPANFDEFSVNPEKFEDQGETVVVTGRFQGKAKSGADLDTPFEHVWDFDAGKVNRFNNDVDQEAWTAAWS
jgi:ketosteroid isomerase-like protein